MAEWRHDVAGVIAAAVSSVVLCIAVCVFLCLRALATMGPLQRERELIDLERGQLIKRRSCGQCHFVDERDPR